MSTSFLARDQDRHDTLQRERHARLRAEAERDRFFDLAADLLCVTDTEGVVRRANAAWAGALGFTTAELVGQPLTDFVHPHDRVLVADAFTRLARRKKSATFECRCRTRDGGFRWLEWHAAPWPEQELIFASARDATDRKRAEAEIQKLAAFPRMNPSAVFEFAEDGSLTYFNDAALELARLAGQQHPGSILPGGIADLVGIGLARGKGQTRVETTVGGRAIAWSFHAVPASGVVHGYASDITERREADDRLREQAALLDKAQDAIVVRDLAHRVLYWNEGAERLFGWTAIEAVGQSAFELQRENQQVLESLRRTLETGEWHGELRHATKAGGEVIVESRWTLVRGPDGQPKSLLIISTDITARKELETQFLRAQRLESIGTLASGIAHDLNNVLSPILMSVNLLQESITDAQDRRLLDTLRLSALRGADMVKQILTFTRGKEGARAVINLRHLVPEVARIIRDTFPRRIQIETHLARELWPVLADTTQFHQVLMNLCVNARDAMPGGGELTILLENVQLEEKHRSLQPEARPGRFVRLCVRDTGTGIPPDVLGKIWEPFFTLKPPGEGSGLGLSTVASIVRAHDGFVHVESCVGHGSCFEIFWPSTDAVEETPPAVPVAGAVPGRGQTILVVDDERAFQEITRAIFQKNGYRVLTAGDGSEAIALFARSKDEIDLVLTDMVMPCLDGPATIAALQRISPSLPIIATSGLTENETRIGGVRRATFLLKPFTTEKLLSAVSEALHPSAAQP